MHTLFERAVGWFCEVRSIDYFKFRAFELLALEPPCARVAHKGSAPPLYTHVGRLQWQTGNVAVADAKSIPPSSSPVVKQPFAKIRYVVYDFFFYIYTGCLYVLVLTFFYIWVRLIFTMCIKWWWFFMVKSVTSNDFLEP